ncbi:MAG: recombinase family protein [Clostridia bacterium]|nr:recombinase family protein [Clostridia bacterium]
MERIVERVQFPLAKPPGLERVAAYARVSSGKDAMLHSLSAQISYYNQLIQSTPGWIFAGVYSDEALTGTKESRDGFQNLIADCRLGKIDRVITKSISRFARNTVMLLNTIRELKSLGIDVYFEEQLIHSMSAEGELMLTILASYAQEESRSASENQKWRVRTNFKSGMPWNGTIYGYRYDNGKFVVQPNEASVIKGIFEDYLAGDGSMLIAKRLNAREIPTRTKKKWCHRSIMVILRNYAYTGNLLLQTTYRENHITKKKMYNTGELPMYRVEGTHEAIVDMDTFLMVQMEIARRNENTNRSDPKKSYTFTSKLICEGCGKKFRRKVTKSGPVWVCSTFNQQGKAMCPLSRQVPEEIMMNAATQALGIDNFNNEEFASRIDTVIVGTNNELHFNFFSGSTYTTSWQPRSRSNSWTEEMKEQARRNAQERWRKVTA